MHASRATYLLHTFHDSSILCWTSESSLEESATAASVRLASVSIACPDATCGRSGHWKAGVTSTLVGVWLEDTGWSVPTWLAQTVWMWTSIVAAGLGWRCIRVSITFSMLASMLLQTWSGWLYRPASRLQLGLLVRIASAPASFSWPSVQCRSDLKAHGRTPLSSSDEHLVWALSDQMLLG